MALIDRTLLATWIDRPEWMADAACREHDSRMWFPERGEDHEPAITICTSCLVTTECLAYALDNDEKFGIWGGTSARARRRLTTTSDQHHDSGGITPSRTPAASTPVQVARLMYGFRTPEGVV